jgi:hypothetical protein
MKTCLLFRRVDRVRAPFCATSQIHRRARVNQVYQFNQPISLVCLRLLLIRVWLLSELLPRSRAS